MTRPIVDVLQEALGPEKVFTDSHTLSERRRDYWVLSQLDDMQGRGAPEPVCVVQPETTDDVVTIVNICRENATPLVPFGLGSGVCGGVIVDATTVLLDMSEMNRTRDIDMDNLIAKFDAGVRGTDAEEALNKRGLMLGHYPQSMDLSTVGGWVATRSAGQFSSAYGNIEDVLLGLEVVLPNGEVFETCETPRASAGPDLKQLFLGSEGTLGVITAVTFSVHWKPEKQDYSVYHAPSMDAGFDLQRAIIQSGWTPPVMRQYDTTEAWRLFPDQAKGNDAFLILVHEGPAVRVEAEKAACAALAAEANCEPGSTEAAEIWMEERNHVPTFETFLEKGVILDTIEIAATWDRIGNIYKNTVASLSEVENILTASAHSSHSYRSGINLYFTFAARPDDANDMADVYRDCWRRTMEATVAGGGGISHHHGIGRLRRDWMPEELGQPGVGLLRDIKHALDPTNFMNPGVLIPDE
ncbi:MAG: FAD-binding oxidoreductase [Pseudomonadota bacterium]